MIEPKQTKGASASPSQAKLPAMVLATEVATGRTLYLKNKLGSATMSTPAAYELAKRNRENPLVGNAWIYEVQLIKLS